MFSWVRHIWHRLRHEPQPHPQLDEQFARENTRPLTAVVIRKPEKDD